ncbi:MAG TPA: Kazal-type serine protease inhibitor domain-containing protein [Saprospiraceae bacterium]|nr:Kazal-type serine protease inhibitor domain-containing protein [Saprospiraceae bacterium]
MKIFLQLLGICLLTLCLSCSNHTNVPEDCVEKPNPDCFCTQQYDPVCGCNNKNYSNACMAECAGIKSYKKGNCQ